MEVARKFKVTTEENLAKEAVLGGVSNGGPAPGFRAKMNEEEGSLEWLEQDKPHRVNIFEAREDLASLALEVSEKIRTMHLPEKNQADKMTEKMIKNKLLNIYTFLKKISSLTN